MSLRSSRYLVVLFSLIVLAAMSTPSEARGGRGGRGGGGRPSGGGARPGAGPSGANLSGSGLGSQNTGSPKTLKNFGGQPSGSPRNLTGNQQFSDALKQGELPGGQHIQVDLTGAQNLQSTFQQHATQWQQRSPGERSAEAQQNIQNRINELQNGPEPFTAAWYADHPNAWQYTHPHADAAAVATAAGVAAWLGVAYATPTIGSSNTTVVFQEVPAEEVAPIEQPTPVAANLSPLAEEWMALGTYSLNANPGSPPTIMLQLAVNHTGQLKGVYYDSLTNTTHNVSGSLDRATQLAQWSLDTNQQLAFSAPLNELLTLTGTVQVKLATGPQQWQVKRLEEN